MRNLTLKKEILAELTDGELGDVVGASYKTKYECTESHQVCLSLDGCVSVLNLVCLAHTPLCLTEMYG